VVAVSLAMELADVGQGLGEDFCLVAGGNREDIVHGASPGAWK
jgi:hypothetical protein